MQILRNLQIWHISLKIVLKIWELRLQTRNKAIQCQEQENINNKRL